MTNELIEQLDSINVRKIAHNGKWWFSAVDLVKVLSESKQPTRYWKEFQETHNLDGFGKIEHVKMKDTIGRMQKTDCVDYDAAIRVIEVIPSPKALPLQLWMHTVIKERIEEMGNPDLAISRGQERAKAFFLRKGYSPEWIKERIEGIASGRTPLTDEWKERGIKQGSDYAKLTNINHEGTFGVTVGEHKQLKDVPKKESLRNNMVPIEISFCSWAERFQKETLKKEDPKSPDEVERLTTKTATAIAEMRKTAEDYLGRKIATPERPLKELK